MKLLKKIAPLAVACLLGLTSFAVAQDLGSWHNNFPGSDTAIVFHQNADALAVVDLTAALGATGDGAEPPEGTAHLIEAPGNDWEYSDSFADVETALGDPDLPTLLADGRYRESRGETENDETYTQVLEFTDGTNTLVFDAEEDEPEAADTYLYMDDGVVAYTYTLEFDSPIEYDVTSAATIDEDFELTRIEMLGREYTIVDADDDDLADNIVDELTLMAGALKASQWEYSTETYTMGGKTYEVEVKIISDESESAILVINGEETDEMEEGDTYTLSDDTRVGVVDVVPNEGAEMTGEEAIGNDLVTFYLGAEKIVFDDGAEVEINGEDIDGSNCEIVGAEAGELESIELTVEPEDNVYLAAGESWTDPILGRFKFTFQGLIKESTLVEGSVTGDDGEVKLTNNKGDELEIPVILDDAANVVYPGDNFVDADVFTDQYDNGYTEQGGNLFLIDDDLDSGDGERCAVDGAVATVDLDDCEGILVLAVGTGGEAKILEVQNLRDDGVAGWNGDDEIVLQNVKDSDEEWTCTTDGAACNLGSFATVEITTQTVADVVGAPGNDPELIFAEFNNFDDGDNGAGYPSFENELAGELGVEWDATEVNFYVFTDDGTDLVTGTNIAWEFDDDGTGDLIIVEDSGNQLTWVDKEDGSDYIMALDNANFGAIFDFDSDNDDWIQMEYPEEEVIGKAYVSEELATIPELVPGYAGGAAIGAYDTELATVQDMNLMFVGGSGINSGTAELLGLDYPTYGTDQAWVDATGVDALGKAMIQVMESPYAEGKYAMIVAGWEDTDTARAAKVLREGTPTLTGDKVLLDTATETVTVIA